MTAPDHERPPHSLDAIDAGLSPAHEQAAAVAEAWAGYGHTADDLHRWAWLGIHCPRIAAECRAAGFDVRAEPDRRFLRSALPSGVLVAEALDDGDLSPEAALQIWKDSQ